MVDGAWSSTRRCSSAEKRSNCGAPSLSSGSSTAPGGEKPRAVSIADSNAVRALVV